MYEFADMVQRKERWLVCVEAAGGSVEAVDAVVLGPHVEVALFRMVGQLRLMFSEESKLSEVDLTRFVKASFFVSDQEFGEREALEWAEGFEFPTGINIRDEFDLQLMRGDLGEVAKSRHFSMGDTRLSLSRIESLGYVDEDIIRLQGLVRGMDIIVEQNFVPNSVPPKLRAKYLRVAPAFNKMILEQYEAGAILIMSTAAARNVPGVHFSSAHWTVKSGKKKGRNIGDCSNAEDGAVLNSAVVQGLVRDKWGIIKHPGPEDLVLMIMRQMERVGIDQLVLYKMDLKGAFTLLFINPDHVRRLAFELTDGLTMFYITGMFGWTGTPAAFDVVSRVIRKSLKLIVTGDADIYVDDIMGVCSRGEMLSEMQKVRDLLTGLLGPSALAVEKEETSIISNEIVWVGWGIDLKSGTISLSTKNCLKCVYAFFSVNLKLPVKISTVQSLASLSSRYAKVCRLMRPFCGTLYNEMKGMRSRVVSKQLGVEAVRCVELWRVFLVMMELGSNFGYRRSLESFLRREVKFVVEYDASLTGLGIILYKLVDGDEVIWKVVSVVLPYRLEQDSSFQNTVEFIAVVLAMACLASLGISNASVRLRGDNVSSLRWSVKERFKGSLCLNAAVVYIAIGSHCDLRVEETIHLPGVENITCDGLSRGIAPSGFGFTHDQLTICENQEELFEGVLNLCRPSALIPGFDFNTFWISVNSLVMTWGFRSC